MTQQANKVAVINVQIAVAVPGDERNYEAYLADAINETLREHQRAFSPESVILDYAIGDYHLTKASANDYAEGEAFQ